MKKVAIIGPGQESSELAKRFLKEKYGDDIIILTDEQAKQAKVSEDQIVNLPTMQIINPYNHSGHVNVPEKTGKQKRRERRRTERKNKKKK